MNWNSGKKKEKMDELKPIILQPIDHHVTLPLYSTQLHSSVKRKKKKKRIDPAIDWVRCIFFP